MKKFVKFIIILSICCLSLCSCGKAIKPSGFPATAGGVTLNSKPTRIAALSAAAVNTVKYLCGEDVLVGVCDDANVSVAKEKIGTAANPDTEKIISLSCDIVFSNEPLPEWAKSKLALAGINVAVFPAPVYFSDVKSYYNNFATLLLGTQQAALRADDAVDEITATAPAADAKRAVFYITAEKVATPDTVMGQLMSCAGFVNAAQNKSAFSFSKEDLLDAAPEIIFCATGLSAQIKADPALASLPAVVNGQVYEIDVTPLRMTGNAYIQGVQSFKTALAPSQSESNSSGE